MLALVNQVALERFADRGVGLGMLLVSALPELASAKSQSELQIGSHHYRCRWRSLRLGDAEGGRLLILEEILK
jgi:hypothetical protein